MTNSREPWADKEDQPHAREGAKFKPVHPENATAKAEIDRVRGMQEIKRFGTGPTNHTSNPSG